MDRALWERCFPLPLEGYWWYWSLEKAGLGDQFTFFYGVIERDGRAVGIAPAFLMDVPMDIVAPPLVAKGLKVVGKVVKGVEFQRTLFVGSVCSEEGTVGLTDGVKLGDVAEAVQDAVEEKAREQKAVMRVWKDFPEGALAELDALARARGLFRLVSFPNTRVELPGTYEDYLKNFSSSHRYHFKKKLKKGKSQAPIETTVIQKPDAGVMKEIFGLFWQTYEKGTTKFERLNPAFFDHIALQEPAWWVLLRRKDNDRLAAFMLCFAGGDRVINKFIGIDYTLDRGGGEWFLYFQLWEACVHWAISRGAKSIQSGQTGYWAKLDVGHALVPLFNYAKHRNPVVQAVYRQVAKGISWETLDADLKVRGKKQGAGSKKSEG